ncbi:MAG: molybdate ABC transporter substrate-binding protein [Chloroflexi bacterium]|nr:molybdate ABC transporter substrate-binding protein [Chloroflexota bacterium]
MRRIRSLLLGCAWLILIAGCGTAPEAAVPSSSVAPSASAVPSASASSTTQDTSLTVFAAASLTEAFGEIGQQFEQQHGIKVTFNFAGSQQLSQQLAQGAEADVFASANRQEMQNAITSGSVISGTEQIFVRNRLVVIVPKDNPGQISQLQDLARSGLKLVFAAEQVPVGGYTQQALTKMSADPAFGSDFGTKVIANVVSQEQNVKSVVTKVSLGEADAGVVYTSDVTPAVSDTIATVAIPDTFNQIAAYPIAPTSDPPAGQELAQQFVDFVLSAEGQSILGRYNFIVEQTGN